MSLAATAAAIGVPDGTTMVAANPLDRPADEALETTTDPIETAGGWLAVDLGLPGRLGRTC